MIHFDHPSVMGLCGVVPPEENDRETYDEVYWIMPRMDTTLKRVIRSKQKLSGRHIQFIIYQIARGLEYMHSGGIIHRDLDPDNILINCANCRLKIAGFNRSRCADMDKSKKLTQYVVTRWYRAPEVMCSDTYDHRIDVWSLGCISAELFHRRPVFKGRRRALRFPQFLSEDSHSLLFVTNSINMNRAQQKGPVGSDLPLFGDSD